jgi:type III restriction enzyme
LIEQSIGRGLRLPYGKRTGVTAVDRLSIVAHDRFQEIIDEANRPDSVIRLQQVILDPSRDLQKMVTVVAPSNLMAQFAASTPPAAGAPVPSVPSPHQLDLAGVAEQPDIAEIVQKMTHLVVQQTIDIPRILVLPKGEVSTGFHPFQLETLSIHYQPVDRDLLIQHLRTHAQETLSFGDSGAEEQRLEDYLVRGLIDFDDISYDDHADLLYNLAGQMVKHLLSYLSEADARNVLLYHQKQLVSFIHVQMQAHYWEKATGYEVVVSKGFPELKSSAYTAAATDTIHDFRQTVQERSRIAQMLFGGFQRCLYPIQKFQSDSERRLAVIVDREVLKWFKPTRGQFQSYYKSGVDHLEYQPDFVAETADCLYLLEAKARNDMDDPEVQAKKDAAVQWCHHATHHAVRHGGKHWQYLLIPHDVITENMTLAGLASQYRVA